MIKRTMAVAALRLVPTDWIRLGFFLAVIVFLIAWSSASTGRPSAVPSCAQNDPGVRSTTVAENAPDAAPNDVESVTMSIPLEEGAVIDIDAPTMGVKIEKWNGGDILVIVEKTKRLTQTVSSSPADPVNIQVTRQGKDVRIQATGAAQWRERGMDVSFRIVLPDQYDLNARTHDNSDTAARLGAALWHAFHREAIEWLLR